VQDAILLTKYNSQLMTLKCDSIQIQKIKKNCGLFCCMPSKAVLTNHICLF